MSDQSEPFEEVSLTQRGDNYAIGRLDSKGMFSEISLSGSNLLSLLPLIQRACAELLETLSSPDLKAQGVEPITAIPVHGFVVGNDLHGTEIYLSFEDKDGNSYRFSFAPPGGVRRIAQRLIERADQLADTKPSHKAVSASIG